ncbi:AAA family ATPase [Flavobacterium sp. ZS1P14]|uniref:AAA family ATPase n=1 Tax=Flavobacterium sp. ZS1P14 TaxID=3401729 RepID=UPI003AAE7C38
MKISKLHIDQFIHLENLTFDFTYQSGDRKGQPLDKICFIGQSATGKMSLLDLIYDYNKVALNLEVINGEHLSIRNNKAGLNGEIEFTINDTVYKQKNDEFFFKNQHYKYGNIGGGVTPLIPIDTKKDVFYFKANLISKKNIELFSKNPIDLIEKHSVELQNIESCIEYKEYGILFNDDVEPQIWLFLLNEILNYRKSFTKKMSELIHKGLLANAKKLDSEFQKWQKDNPNQLESFAKKINPILEKLFLEVDLVDTEYSIPIKNKRTDETIPIQDTSTGTKGLLLSLLPLYKLDTKDSIILMDEPERSLYPDMQMDLMDCYTNLAPEAQFIVATHSPFIAAAFEPDERFILYFDEKGKVAVRRGSSPIGDDPNDILFNDFGLTQLINKAGQEVYNDYLEKKRQMLFEENTTKKKQLQKEIETIGDKYNF